MSSREYNSVVILLGVSFIAVGMVVMPNNVANELGVVVTEDFAKTPHFFGGFAIML